MKRKLVYRIVLSAALLLTAFSCSKDELTKPAAVNLQMAMGNNQAKLRVQSKNLVIIEKTRYRLSAMEFEGYRQNGNNYFFTKEFPDGQDVWAAENQPGHVVNFDMPQGVYEQVKISLKVKKSEGKGSKGGREKSASANAYNENAAILMFGYYTNTHEEQIPLVFVYDFDEAFEYTAGQTPGNSGIAVEKSQNNQATIVFNASYWMQLINGRMLQSAKLTELEGVPSIIISENQNEHIFNLLTSRIKGASELTFN